MTTIQAEPLPTEQTLILEGIDLLRAGDTLPERHRLLLIRWIDLVPEDLLEPLLIDREPTFHPC